MEAMVCWTFESAVFGSSGLGREATCSGEADSVGWLLGAGSNVCGTRL